MSHRKCISLTGAAVTSSTVSTMNGEEKEEVEERKKDAFLAILLHPSVSLGMTKGLSLSPALCVRFVSFVEGKKVLSKAKREHFTYSLCNITKGRKTYVYCILFTESWRQFYPSFFPFPR